MASGALTHSLIHSCTHLPIHPHTHSLTHALVHSLTHSRFFATGLARKHNAEISSKPLQPNTKPQLITVAVFRAQSHSTPIDTTFDECFALCTHRKISWGNIHQKHKLKNRTTRPETIHYRYKCCVTSTNPHDSRHPLSGGVGTGLEIVCTGLRVVNQVDDCAKVDDCARWSL